MAGRQVSPAAIDGLAVERVALSLGLQQKELFPLP
jgi:hypothetical protein